MRANIAAIFCDHQDGCDEWVVDYYDQGVTNWRDCMRGWQYNPHKPFADEHLCPRHAGQ